MKLFEKKSNSYKKTDEEQLIHDNSWELITGVEKLIERIGDERIVMLGEASHGTHEYYIWRAVITQQLIEKKGFNVIGVEGDWPDCYQINRYIRGYENSGETAIDVLKNFKRWPAWMWANWEIAALMEGLKRHNSENNHQVGFYGLDVYSLWESLEAILDYLSKNDPEAFRMAKKAMECFDPFEREAQEYAVSTRFTPQSCEKEVIELLREIRSRVQLYDSDPEAPFNAEQNAMTAVNAERYYRAMIGGGPESWNIRDHHMTDTLERLLNFHGEKSKAVVWEHNTHIGDARATTMKRRGMVNVGQLVREKWGTSASFSIGFGSNVGSVIAGSSWGAQMQKMKVPEARPGSWEAMLHNAGPGDKVILTENIRNNETFKGFLDHRAIGVVYDPETEKYGNYVPSIIPLRYDAFVFIDETMALHPLETNKDKQLVPELYPFGV